MTDTPASITIPWTITDDKGKDFFGPPQKTLIPIADLVDAFDGDEPNAIDLEHVRAYLIDCVLEDFNTKIDPEINESLMNELVKKAHEAIVADLKKAE